jgi:hypothetical protein
MWKFIIYTHKILLGWPNQGEWMDRARITQEMRNVYKILVEGHEGKKPLGSLGVAVSILLEWLLDK